MRIVIGADTYAPDINGASYFAQRLAAGLVDRGHEVHVVCPARGPRERARPPRQDGQPIEHRLRSVPVPRPAGFRLCPAPGLVDRTRTRLSQVRPAVVHVQSHFLLGRALTTAARSLAIPVVATTHMRPENIAPYIPAARWSRWFEAGFWRGAAKVLGRADVVTAPTPFAASTAEAHGVPGPIVPVSNGLDLTRFRPDRSGAAFAEKHGLVDRPTVGYVGRLDREKHVDEIIEALALLRRRVDAQLLVVGEGSERRRLVELARHRGVGDALVMTGFVSDHDLPEAYAAMDVFVNSGRAELQSLVTMEAMASGLPIVAVDAGALPHLVHDGENGYRYPAGDVASLARALTTLLTDPGRAAAASRRSLEIVGPHTLDATLDTYEAIYRGWRPDSRNVHPTTVPSRAGALDPDLSR